MQMRDAVECKAHAQNQPTPRLLLEQAVAVGEVAFFEGEIAQLAGLAIQRGEAGEYILDLDAVGTDVLHRRSANRAGNQAEVFQPGESLRQRVLHKRMPRLARFRLDHHTVAVIADHTNPARGHAQHQRRNICR
ncbi:hypothetical protein D3C72_1135520 [compost metagenome]